MQIILSLLFVLLAQLISAQINSEFELETLSGYENNIFKSPSSFVDPDSGELLGKEDLYTNSIFQQVAIKGLFTKEWNNNNLTLRLLPRAQIFLSESQASYYTIYSRLRYEKEISNKTKWQVTSHFNYRDRDGENLDDNELRTPLGYRHFDVSTRLFFRLYKQSRSFVEIEYGNRNYQDGETNKLWYDYVAVNTIFRNVFKNPAGYHSYGVEASFSKRFYERNYFDPEEADETRNWTYFTAEPFYRIPITEKWRVRAGLEWQRRIDNDRGSFTYSQLRPSVELRYKTETFMAQLNGSYTNRGFNSLNATDVFGEVTGKLNLKYYRLRLEMEQKIGKNLYLTSDAYMINRESNRKNLNTTGFRSYQYFYAGIGLTFTF
ncbi:MAG: hypothetical protein HRT68_12010 [Flavobacteriaceae bacterium]|nr:hypothetical protein [Flavobacteriaceae bacterium]